MRQRERKSETGREKVRQAEKVESERSSNVWACVFARERQGERV